MGNNREPRENLRSWREWRGITQTELARRVGVTKGEISRLESGSRRMTVEWMTKIAEAMGLTMEQLLGPAPVYRNREEMFNDTLRRDPGAEFGIRPNSAQTGLIDVEGDEMVGTVDAGDAVIVDRARRVPSPSGLFAVEQLGTTVVRRLQAMPDGRIRVSCDNRRYDAVDVDPAQIEIVGRVTARIMRL